MSAVDRAKARARELSKNPRHPPASERLRDLGQPNGPAHAMHQPGPMSVGEFMNQGQVAKASDSESEPRSKEDTLHDVQALNAAAGQYQQALIDAPPDASTAPVPEAEETVQEQDAFLDMLRSDGTQDLLNNSDNRRRIEQNLVKMNFEDYLLKGEVLQEVELRKGFRITYRSLTTGEDLEIKRLMFGVGGSDRYVNDLYAVRCLAASLYSVNDKPLPNHLDANHALEESLLLTKVNHVFKWSIHLARYAYVNFVWFDERLQRMVSGIGEELGNG